MALNCEKFGRAVTLIFLPKTFISNETKFRPSNSLNLAELVANELTKSIFKKKNPFSIRFIAACCEDFRRSMSLKNEITFQKSSSV